MGRLFRSNHVPRLSAFGWALARFPDLEENVRAVGLAHTLTDAEIAEIDDLFPVGAASGTRYAEGGMKTLNR